MNKYNFFGQSLFFFSQTYQYLKTNISIVFSTKFCFEKHQKLVKKDVIISLCCKHFQILIRKQFYFDRPPDRLYIKAV